MLKTCFGNENPQEYEGFTNKSNKNWTPKEVHHSVKTYIQNVKNELASSRPNPVTNNKPNLTNGEIKSMAKG